MGKKKTYEEIDYDTIDDKVTVFLKKKFGDKFVHERYECIAYQEWNNDSQHTFEVKPIEDDELEDISEINSMNELMFQLHNILNWMCKEGKFKKGNYIICVCW
jgi:hypothetical protein